METIKQKLNLIHLYSEHKVDNVGFFFSSLSSFCPGVGGLLWEINHEVTQ